MKSTIALLLTATSFAYAATDAKPGCVYTCPPIPFTGAVPASLVGQSNKGTVVECRYLAVDKEQFDCDYDTVSGVRVFAGAQTCPQMGLGQNCHDSTRPHHAHKHASRAAIVPTCAYTCPWNVNGATGIGNDYSGGDWVKCYYRRTDSSIFSCGYSRTNGTLVNSSADDCDSEKTGYGLNCPLPDPVEKPAPEKRHMEYEYYN